MSQGGSNANGNARTVSVRSPAWTRGFDETNPSSHACTALFLGCILAMATLKCSPNYFAWWIGNVAVAAVMSCAFVVFSIRLLWGYYPAWRGTGLWFSWALMFAIYVARVTDGPSWHMVAYRMGQLIGVFGVFAFASSLRSSAASIRYFTSAYLMTLVASWIALSLYLLYTGWHQPANPNSIGLLSLLCIAACILRYHVGDKRKSRVLFLTQIIFFIGLLVASESRSSWMAGFVFLIGYMTYYFYPRSPALYSTSFAVLVGFIGLIVYFNSVKWHEEMKIEMDLANLNTAFSSKPLYTREKVWLAVVKSIEDYPFTGLGTGWTREVIASDALSAHSNYLQIGLQTGLPGIAAFLAILYGIGFGLSRLREDQRFGRIGLALLLALLIQSGFESCLTENDLPLGVSAWAFLGICLSLHLRQIRRASASIPGGIPGNLR